MDGLWVCSDPAKLFLDKLRRKRAIEFMRNESYLRQLRYNHEMAERDPGVRQDLGGVRHRCEPADSGGVG